MAASVGRLIGVGSSGECGDVEHATMKRIRTTFTVIIVLDIITRLAFELLKSCLQTQRRHARAYICSTISLNNAHHNFYFLLGRSLAVVGRDEPQSPGTPGLVCLEGTL